MSILPEYNIFAKNGSIEAHRYKRETWVPVFPHGPADEHVVKGTKTDDHTEPPPRGYVVLQEDQWAVEVDPVTKRRVPFIHIHP